MQVGLGLAGGASAAVFDRVAPREWTQTIGADPAKPGSGVTVTPGAIASGVIALGAMVFGKGGTAAKVFGSLATGGLVYEGVKAADQSLLPQLAQYIGGVHGLPAAQGVYGLPGYHRVSDYELAQGLAQYGMR